MYALQAEPESATRAGVLALGVVINGALFGLTLGLASRLHLTPPQHATERITMQIVQLAPKAAPVPAAEPPKPLVAQSKPPEVKHSAPPPRQPAPAPAPSEPAPMVVGLTLSSTTQSGHGPRFALGNTLLGTPSRIASQHSGEPAAQAGSSERPIPEVTSASAGQERVAAKMRRGVEPQYPAAARRAGVEGVVVLSITISANGQVEAASILRSLGSELDEAALRAARATLWEPATVGGRGVPSKRRFNVRFSLVS